MKTTINITEQSYKKSIKSIYKNQNKFTKYIIYIILIIVDYFLAISEVSLLYLVTYNLIVIIFLYLFEYLNFKLFYHLNKKYNKLNLGLGKQNINLTKDYLEVSNNKTSVKFYHKDIKKIKYQKNSFIIYYKLNMFTTMVELFDKSNFIKEEDYLKLKELLSKKVYNFI